MRSFDGALCSFVGVVVVVDNGIHDSRATWLNDVFLATVASFKRASRGQDRHTHHATWVQQKVKIASERLSCIECECSPLRNTLVNDRDNSGVKSGTCRLRLKVGLDELLPFRCHESTSIVISGIAECSVASATYLSRCLPTRFALGFALAVLSFGPQVLTGYPFGYFRRLVRSARSMSW